MKKQNMKVIPKNYFTTISKPQNFIVKYKKYIITAIVIIILFLVIFLPIYFTVIRTSSSSGNVITPVPPTPAPTPTPAPKPTPAPVPAPKNTWLSNLYKSLNWQGAPTSENGGKVSQAWINWAMNSPNSILQYYVNYRRTTQKEMDATNWPTTDADIVLNPVYSWDGLVTAVYIWNIIVDFNNASSNKPLGNITGFCNEDDIIKRQMTLAAFLGNATVESAYFLVCKESTVLANGTLCPGGNPGDFNYNPRYFNNCENADPMGYSCEGGGGSCSPTALDTKTVCNTSGCYPTDAGKYFCNVTSDGTTWDKWDNTTVKTESDCNAHPETYKFWCPSITQPPTPPPKPTTPFNPVKDNCTGGWPQCQFPGSDGKFIQAPAQPPSSDPCMSDPYADGSMTGQLNNNNPNCSDWNGNKWQQQQQCYFGRGLIQLTWSCNYYQAQRNMRLMASLVPSNTTDPILQAFLNAVNLPLNDPNSINLCANPDSLCGNFTLDKNSKVIYSNNLIQRSIPWLSCIIFWSTKCSTSTFNFNKCYSFSSSYQCIGPSGAGDPQSRLNAMKFLMTIMGNNISDTNTFISTDTDFLLNLSGCSAGGGGGGGGGSKNRCGLTWNDPKICTNPTCVSPTDCASIGANANCYQGLCP